ncbi:MAG: hypothetical protein GY806_20965 [Gammaproteobacteria bacterium]|nr:hypothetical protein [Gammaproteobacteria bacterium]
MPTSMHCHDRYVNNRAEVSHELTRAQERQMRRFKYLDRSNDSWPSIVRFTISFVLSASPECRQLQDAEKSII